MICVQALLLADIFHVCLGCSGCPRNPSDWGYEMGLKKKAAPNGMSLTTRAEAWLLTIPLNHDRSAKNGVAWNGREELDERLRKVFPAGEWLYTGQCEVGSGGTDYEHAQLMLICVRDNPRVDGALIWNKLDKHVYAEPVGRNREHSDYVRVRNYVHKEETRMPAELGGGEFNQGDCDAWIASQKQLMTTKKQGKRNDLNSLRELAQRGVSYDEIMDDPKYTDYLGTAVRYEKAYRRWVYAARERELCDGDGNRKELNNVYMWGDAGLGKTTHAITALMRKHDGERPYIVGTNSRDTNRLFEGYDTQKGVVFDEFTDKALSVQQMNVYLDNGCPQLPARYANRTGLWDACVICSNYMPLTLYSRENRTVREALLRRIGTYVFFRNLGDADGVRTVGLYDMTQWVRDEFSRADAADYERDLCEWIEQNEPFRTIEIPMDCVRPMGDLEWLM